MENFAAIMPEILWTSSSSMDWTPGNSINQRHHHARQDYAMAATGWPVWVRDERILAFRLVRIWYYKRCGGILKYYICFLRFWSMPIRSRVVSHGVINSFASK